MSTATTDVGAAKAAHDDTRACPRAVAVEGDGLDGQFERIDALLRAAVGLRLNQVQRGLVRARLAPRIRTLGKRSVREYVDYVQSPAGHEEFLHMVDSLTNNKTAFFGEAEHFDYLEEILRKRARDAGPITVWSAGCSSGEEPYSIAMLLAEHQDTRGGGRILATDVNREVLRAAVAGRYARRQLLPVPPMLKRRHLTKIDESGWYEVSAELRATVRFARLNLVGDWPMKGPFDVIFCRNVMRYFDESTKERLVGRLIPLLGPGGHLFLGESESLYGIEHDLKYVRRSVYRRR